jgi:uncharacterized BrkB/YihY/UPF0761 family membrane protein
MASVKDRGDTLIAAVDTWQRQHRFAGVGYAVTKKFSDDNANLLVVALGWYGFTAIYPLLLIVVTIFGFVGAESLGKGIVDTLHKFPVIGDQFNPGGGRSNLHGSVLGLVIGLVLLLYGAQGVTQTAEQAMSTVWNMPPSERPGFVARLGRSVAGLVTIGGAFLVNAFLAPIAAGHGIPLYVRILLIAGMLVINCGFYLVAFRVLTAADAGWRELLPGSVLAALGFTALITVGAGLVQHQLRESSATYGALAAVIGLVTFLLLLSKLTLYAAELNPVLARKLWPRALPTCPPTAVDEEVLRAHAAGQPRGADPGVGGPSEPNAHDNAHQVAGADALERH